MVTHDSGTHGAGTHDGGTHDGGTHDDVVGHVPWHGRTVRADGTAITVTPGS